MLPGNLLPIFYLSSLLLVSPRLTEAALFPSAFAGAHLGGWLHQGFGRHLHFGSKLNQQHMHLTKLWSTEVKHREGFYYYGNAINK